MKPVTLYAAEISLYSGKARAYLRYKRVPFTEVPPSRVVIETVIKPRTGLRMVPVIIDGDDVAVQDTSAIIDHVEARVPERPVIPTTPVQRFVSHLLELYADEWLLLPAMHHRWAYPRQHLTYIAREFGALFQPTWPAWTHVAAGLPLVAYFGLAHGPVLGLDRTTKPAVETTYLAFLDAFDAHLAVHPFVLGAAPTLADFGLMAPLYAHLYRDPVPGRLMKERAPRVADWVERMNRLDTLEPGPLVADDAIPETLGPILAVALGEHGAVIADTWRHVEGWVAGHPGERVLPRFIGRHAFRVGEAEGTRSVQSYTAWMSQRAKRAWDDLTDVQRAPFRRDGHLWLDDPLPVTLDREHGRVVVAQADGAS